MWCGVITRPIKLGLVLEGVDAERFEEYLRDPPELLSMGQELFEEVKKTASDGGLLPD